MSTAHNKVKDDNDDDDERLIKLLDEQYQALEDYCNAQTCLYNAMMIHSSKQPPTTQAERLVKNHPNNNSRPSISTANSPALALRSYRDALLSVQTNLRLQRDMMTAKSRLTRSFNTTTQRLMRDHLDRMNHILAMIGGGGGQSPLMHSNGIPAKTIDVDEFTLALSATRASIRVVKDALVGNQKNQK